MERGRPWDFNSWHLWVSECRFSSVAMLCNMQTRQSAAAISWPLLHLLTRLHWSRCGSLTLSTNWLIKWKVMLTLQWRPLPLWICGFAPTHSDTAFVTHTYIKYTFAYHFPDQHHKVQCRCDVFSDCIDWKKSLKEYSYRWVGMNCIEYSRTIGIHRNLAYLVSLVTGCKPSESQDIDSWTVDLPSLLFDERCRNCLPVTFISLDCCFGADLSNLIWAPSQFPFITPPPSLPLDRDYLGPLSETSEKQITDGLRPNHSGLLWCFTVSNP